MFGNKLQKSNNIISAHPRMITNTSTQTPPSIESFPRNDFKPIVQLEPVAPINNFEHVNYGSFIYNPKLGW